MTRLHKNVMIVGVLLAAVLAVPASVWANATALPLSTLLANPNFQIISGDKSFTNFSGFETVVKGDGTIDPDPAKILVSAYTSPVTGDYGLSFSSLTTPQWAVLPGQSQDTFFNFDVKILPGFDFLIHDNTLAFTGDTSPTGIIEIREAVFDGQTALIPFTDPKLVFKKGGDSNLTDHREFPELVASATVFKAIHLEDDFVDGDASLDLPIGAPTITNVDTVFQTFSQVSTVPEPLTGALSLIAISALGLTATRRQRTA